MLGCWPPAHTGPPILLNTRRHDITQVLMFHRVYECFGMWKEVSEKCRSSSHLLFLRGCLKVVGLQTPSPALSVGVQPFSWETDSGSARTLRNGNTGQHRFPLCFPCHPPSPMISNHNRREWPALTIGVRALSPQRLHLGHFRIQGLFPSEASLWVDPCLLLRHKRISCTTPMLKSGSL